MSAANSSFGRNVLLSLGFTVGLTLIAFTNNVVISRLAGPDGRGLYAMAVATTALIASILCFGLGQASTYALGKGAAKEHVAAINHFVVLFELPLAMICAGVCFWLVKQTWLPATWMAVAAVCATLPAHVYLEGSRGYYLGLHRVMLFHLCQSGVMVVMLSANAATLRFGDSWVLINFVASYWFVALAMLSINHKTLLRLRWPGMGFARQQLRFGTRASLTTLADSALLRLEYLLMAPFVAIADVGIYAIADQITHLMSWGGLVAGQMMLLESAQDQGGEKSYKALQRAVRIYLGIMLVIGAIALITSPWLIPWIFGGDFEPAAVGVWILFPTVLFKGVHAMFSTYLSGQNAQQPVIRAGVIALIIDAALVLALAPRFSWQGVAVAKVIAYGVQVAFTYRALAFYTAHLGKPQLLPQKQDFRDLITILFVKFSKKSTKIGVRAANIAK